MLRRRAFAGHELLPGLFEHGFQIPHLRVMRAHDSCKTLLDRHKRCHRIAQVFHDLMLALRNNYASALYFDPAARLDDLREAVATYEDAARIARRVFGSAHPTTAGIETNLRNAREQLGAREAGCTGHGTVLQARSRELLVDL